MFLAGSGGYADNNIGAISTTGDGECIMKVVLARLILHHMEQGKLSIKLCFIACNHSYYSKREVVLFTLFQ